MYAERKDFMLFLDFTPDLGDIDYKIYHYVSNNLNVMPYISIRELARKTHTSVATIQRFCKKFQCDGFNEFKIRMKIYIENQTAATNSLNFDTFVYSNFLNRTNEEEFQQQIKEAANHLKSKEFVLFLGVGTSDIMASYGTTYFSSLSKMSLRIEDSITNPKNYISKELMEKCCVIAISASGETTEVVNYLSNINFRNSSIVSITNNPNSTIAKLSDATISYYLPTEKFSGQDVTSKLPVLFIIEYLAKILHADD